MSGCRSEAGRLFQILRPATEKLLSPSRVFVLGTVRMLYIPKNVISNQYVCIRILHMTAIFWSKSWYMYAHSAEVTTIFLITLNHYTSTTSITLFNILSAIQLYTTQTGTHFPHHFQMPRLFQVLIVSGHPVSSFRKTDKCNKQPRTDTERKTLEKLLTRSSAVIGSPLWLVATTMRPSLSLMSVRLVVSASTAIISLATVMSNWHCPHTDRQMDWDKDTNNYTHRQTDGLRQRHQQLHTQTDRWADTKRPTTTHTDRQMGWDKETNNYTHRQTDGLRQRDQ